MLFDLLAWWYSKGWVRAWREIPLSLQKVQQAFTFPVLLSTLFSPWKQITNPGGRSIDEKFRAMADNFFSRAVGFFVRLFVLIAALLIMAITAVFSFALAVIWPLVPVAIIYFVFKGITG